MFEALIFILGLSVGLILGASHAYRNMNRKLKNMADHRLAKRTLWIIITKRNVTDEERVAKRMFEAHGRTITYGTSWDKATEPVKKVWLLMAREALDEMKEK